MDLHILASIPPRSISPFWTREIDAFLFLFAVVTPFAPPFFLFLYPWDHDLPHRGGKGGGDSISWDGGRDDDVCCCR